MNGYFGDSHAAASSAVVRSFVQKVFMWMAFALLITAAVALQVVSSPSLRQAIFGARFVFFGLIILELGLVFFLSARIGKMSAGAATAAFVGYSALNGLTISAVLLAYTSASVASTFLITAGMFGAMSIYGFITKRDLSNLGSIFMMGLIGIILASVVNIFLHSETIYWIVTYAGVAIFTGLVAYDTQKIKRMSSMVEQGSDNEHKAAIMGALALYLDFVNLFIMLLRIFGDRRN
ncbi:MAG: Bax inhibitor-1/YccA family protein [Fibrobacterota bacterium]